MAQQKALKESPNLSQDTSYIGEEGMKKGIRSKYIPNEEEYKAVNYVYSRYQAMKSAPNRVKYEKQWNKWEQQWEALRKDKERNEWQSNHYAPMTTAIVETAMAEMVDQTPQPLILPRNKDDIAAASVMKHIFDFTWDVADSDTELYNILKDGLIKGTGIGQEYYYKDRRLVRDASLDGKGNETYIETENFDFDGCYLEAVKLEDFFVDEMARSLGVGPHSARDCIRRYIMDIEDFKLFFSGDIWDPLGNAKYVTPGGDINYYEFYKPPNGIDKSKQVEVLWYWGKKPKDCLYIVANDVPVRLGPNLYRHKQLPFARFVDVKRPHDFYGKGEPELLESIQDEKNTLRRMILDRNHLDIDKMFLVNNSASLNDEDLIARPHGMIPTDDINATKPIEYGDIPNSVGMSAKWLDDDATLVTGIDPRAAALPQAGTATEAAILKEAALKRIRLKMRNLEKETLIPIARLRVSNIIQFMAVPELEKILGETDSDEYQQQIQDLAQKGQLDTSTGTPMKKTYKSVRLENKAINFDETGTPVVQPANGFTFFEADPKYFLPTDAQGFDIQIAAGSTLPISKPLMQSKVTEMYDRLIQLALGGIGYDPVKLGDALITANDLDPSNYRSNDQGNDQAPPGGQTGPNSDARATQLIDLAMSENKMMMQGQQVPPTPYSSPAHTMIHIQFMHSPVWQKLPASSPIIQAFLDHVMGEMMAQEGRNGAAPDSSGGPPAGTEVMTQVKESAAPGTFTRLRKTMNPQLPPRPQPKPAPKAHSPIGETATGRSQVQNTLPALIRGGSQAPRGL